MIKPSILAGSALALASCVTTAPSVREQYIGVERVKGVDQSLEENKVNELEELRRRFAEASVRLTFFDYEKGGCDQVKRYQNCRRNNICDDKVADEEAALSMKVKPETVNMCTLLSPDSNILMKQCVEKETYSEAELIDFFRSAVSCYEQIEICTLKDETVYCDPALRGQDFVSYASYDEMPSSHPDPDINKLVIENKRLVMEKEALIAAIIAADPWKSYFDVVALWATDENYSKLTNEWRERELIFKSAERPTKEMYMKILQKDIDRVRLIISILKPHYCPVKCSKP